MKKNNVIIVHGAYGYPEENWFAWLKNNLEKEEITCSVPQLPTPQNQHLRTWLADFEQAVGEEINERTILIGHSLGAAFILRWLEQYHGVIFSAILVGAFIGSVNDERFDKINHSFFEKPFDWCAIRKRSRYFISYYGTQDQYVAREQYDWIAEKLNAKKIIVSEAGHFNQASGYTEFPHLLNAINMNPR
jgi:predicted alpha/beta hydrolase family esterase